MSDKVISLGEQDLRGIVKECIEKVINEAYGTSSLDTRKSVGSWRGIGSDSVPNPLKGVIDGISRAYFSLSSSLNDEGLEDIKPYLQGVSKCLSRAQDYLDRACNKMIMNHGVQPDADYFD